MPAAMHDDDIAVFNDSLNRCLRDGGFMDRFYERLLASSPQVREKFKQTDFRRQKRVVRESLYVLMRASTGEKAAIEELEERARLHSRSQRDIPPAMYDVWLRCLLATVRECDPGCDERVELAWRRVVQPGIDVMVARY